MRGLTTHADTTAVGDDNFPGDGKTQPHTAFGLAGHAIETVEDQALMLLGNAGPSSLTLNCTLPSAAAVAAI